MKKEEKRRKKRKRKKGSAKYFKYIYNLMLNTGKLIGKGLATFGLAGAAVGIGYNKLIGGGFATLVSGGAGAGAKVCSCDNKYITNIGSILRLEPD
jgi:hypothetical protein